MNLKALTEQRAEKQTEMETLLNTVKTEERAFTEDENELFKKLEFKNMLSRFDADSQNDDSSVRDNFKIVTELSEAEAIWKQAEEKECVGFFFLQEKREI